MDSAVAVRRGSARRHDVGACAFIPYRASSAIFTGGTLPEVRKAKRGLGPSCFALLKIDFWLKADHFVWFEIA